MTSLRGLGLSLKFILVVLWHEFGGMCSASAPSRLSFFFLTVSGCPLSLLGQGVHMALALMYRPQSQHTRQEHPLATQGLWAPDAVSHWPGTGF